MSRLMTALLAAALAAFACACASNGEFQPGPDDKLNEAELAALTKHVKDFVAGSSKLAGERKPEAASPPEKDAARDFKPILKKSRLTDADRAAVKDGEPEVKIVYSAAKEGIAKFVWTLPSKKRIIVSIEGELLSEGRQQIELKIVSSGEPEHFKSDGKPAEPLPEAAKKLEGFQ